MSESILQLSGVHTDIAQYHILQGVDLAVPRGGVTMLLGRNGVGKTSLLKAIVGQHHVSAGQILWEDGDIGALKPYERAKRGIAYVPQGREIFPLLTVRENLETGYAALGRGVRQVVPDEVFELFPVLKSMLSRRGGDLSGGQQQQLAIARALAMDPKILILDEPTEGIQPNIVKQIEEAIIRLNREHGLGIILVEQNVPFAREASDRFLVLDKGRVVMSGRSNELTDSIVEEHLTF